VIAYLRQVVVDVAVALSALGLLVLFLGQL